MFIGGEDYEVQEAPKEKERKVEGVRTFGGIQN